MPLGLSDNLFKRIISALALLPVVLGAIYLGDWWFYTLLVIGGYMMTTEWHMMLKNNQKPYIIGSFLCVSTLPLPILVFQTEETQFALWTIGIILLFALILLLYRPAKLSQIDSSASVATSLSGVAYIGLAILSLMWLRHLDNDGLLVIWLFFAVWAMDVGGYFAGKSIGGPKLAPSISPKKTWAGLIGGMLLAALVSLVISYLFGWGTPLNFAIAGAVVALVAQLGDLYESAIKRHMDIKDSGSIIPGHGGILDRVDGIIFAAPFTALVIAVAILNGAGQ
ncbi:phosphatidate cytidylyltransferase [Kordiimonas aquimaris]|uniref:phosphatidate cytidylyltransferase n=1 Tax=Kordiimonas aquimaris TaxID=707591 RepID=UPI0021D1C10E|nr:phosphatidate cytidylyltransferase [Kordiimonas aquimaris]